MLMRRQFVLTLILMPITFGIWYAAGTLFAAPAVWLTDFLLRNAYPNIVEAAGLQGVEMMIRTQFGEDGGVIMAPTDAGNQIALGLIPGWSRIPSPFRRPLSWPLTYRMRCRNSASACFGCGHNGLWSGFYTRQGLASHGRRAFS